MKHKELVSNTVRTFAIELCSNLRMYGVKDDMLLEAVNNSLQSIQKLDKHPMEVAVEILNASKSRSHL